MLHIYSISCWKWEWKVLAVYYLTSSCVGCSKVVSQNFWDVSGDKILLCYQGNGHHVDVQQQYKSEDPSLSESTHSVLSDPQLHELLLNWVWRHWQLDFTMLLYAADTNIKIKSNQFQVHPLLLLHSTVYSHLWHLWRLDSAGLHYLTAKPPIRWTLNRHK